MFKLELLDSVSPTEIEDRSLVLAERAIREIFPDSGTVPNKDDKYGFPTDNPRVYNSRPAIWSANHDFVEQLKGCSSWGILDHIDGRCIKDPDTRRRQQEKMRFDLGYDFVQEAFTVAVNGAIRGINVNTGRPGYNTGHSIILHNVALDRNSQFYDTITPALQKRLLNGALWEELPQLCTFLNNGIAYRLVEPILAQHAASLDAEFAPQGLEILKRNSSPLCRDRPHFTLNYAIDDPREDFGGLSKRAVLAYGELVEKIDARREELGISENDVGALASYFFDAIRLGGYDGARFLESDERRVIESTPFARKYGNKRSKFDSPKPIQHSIKEQNSIN